MQKRIARSRAEGERIGRQEAANENARLQKQVSELNKRLHGIEIGGKVSTAEAKHLQEMATLEKALEQAHKDGNMTEASRITREMNTKEVAWMEQKRTLMATPVPEEQRTTQPKGPAPEGRAWMTANADWYNKPGFEAETAATIAIDERLLAEGSDPNSPEHYKRIQKELTRKFRDLDVLDPDGNSLRDSRRDRDDRDDDRRDDRRRDDRDEDGGRRHREEREELPLEDPDDDDDDDDQDDDRRRDDDDDDDDRDRGRDRDSRRRDDDDDDEDEREEGDRQRRKPGFMNIEDAGGGGGRRSPMRRKGGKVVLSRSDRSDMIKYGMDPDNDQHVEQWARTIAEENEG